MSNEISVTFAGPTFTKKGTLFECNGKMHRVIAVHSFDACIIDGRLEYSARLFVRDEFGNESHHGMYVTHEDEIEYILEVE